MQISCGHRLHLVVLLLVLPFVGCATLESLYDNSVREAAVFEEAYQSDDLLPIREFPVLVATMTSWDGYREGEALTLSRDVWVTVVPEIRDFCAGLPAKRLDLRVAQYLGLPSDTGYDRIVELEVAGAADLFRPCTDPAIDTTGPCTATFADGTPEAHVAWMGDQGYSAWQIPDGYPWTRLGYTYDWNRKTDRFGASEYVVRRGSTVRVMAVQSTVEYCGSP